MSLFYNPLKMLRVEYNHQRGTSLALEDFQIKQIVDLRDFPGERIDKKNTMLLVDVAGEEVRFFYSRVDLVTNFARAFPLADTVANVVYRLVLDSDCHTSTKTLARPLARAYGLPITSVDIVDEPFTPPAAHGANTVKITFSKESLLFIPGSTATFVIDEGYRVIDGKTYLLKEFSRHPDSFYDDHVARGRTSATYLRIGQMTYGKDYTPVAHLLKRLVGNPTYVPQELIGYQTTDTDAFIGLLAQSLRQCDGLPWTNLRSASSSYNLHAAWVIYNGPVAGLKKLAAVSEKVPAHLVRLMEYGNPDFDNVAVLLLSTHSSNTVLYGAVLHYNNP